MGRVYRARLRGFGGFEKPLVVKQILPELAKDSRFVSMFVEEAKTLVRLAHPHIVPVYELGVVDGVYFLAMERIDGAALRELLRDGPLPPVAAAQLASQLASALDHAHSRFGLIHRDVSPGNVLIDLSGNARLVDFGVSTPADEVVGGVFGTPGYLAPEQLGGRPTHQSDVFGVGAILYAGLAGHAPYPPTLDEVRAAFAAEETPPALGPEVPRALVEIALACLSLDPAQRPADAADARRRLRGWLATENPGGELDALAERAAQARRRASERPPPMPTSVATPVTSGTQTSLATASLLAERAPEEAPVSAPVGAGASEDLSPVRSALRHGPTPLTLQVVERVSAVPAPASDVEADGAAAAEAPPRWRSAALALGAAVLVAGLAFALPWTRTGDGAGPGAEVATSEDARTGDEAGDARTGDEAGDARTGDEADGARTGDEADDARTGDEAALESARTGDEADDARTGDEADGARTGDEAGGARTGDTRSAMDSRSRPRGAARLSVQATPWAEVRIDGSVVGTTPRRGQSLPAGQHRVQLSCAPLGRGVTIPLQVEDGEDVRILADLEVDPPSYRVIRR